MRPCTLIQTSSDSIIENKILIILGTKLGYAIEKSKQELGVDLLKHIKTRDAWVDSAGDSDVDYQLTFQEIYP